MNLLFPLYVAGFLAVSLPILFHLIRRTPRGKTEFSSLMFLRPSPPRLSKRSRLENIVLLLLRALAIILLALAFARPFLRATAFFDVLSSRGRRIAILVDTSASMRQDGLWDSAVLQVKKILDDGSKNDRFALYAFDRKLQTVVAFADAPEREREQQDLIRKRLDALQPSWSDTDLGRALMTLADELHRDQQEDEMNDVAVPQIVLVSDVQQGSRLAALQAYEWPDDVRLAVEQVSPKAAGNASLQWIADAADEETRDQRLRVLVENSELSQKQQFELVWETPQPDDEETTIRVHVPPGESRVVRVPLPEGPPGDRLVLRGDAQPFDNTLYVAVNERPQVVIGYWGADSPDEVEQMQYYLQRAFASTQRVEFKVLQQEENTVEILNQRPRLLVATRTPTDAETDALLQFVKQGGSALYVIGPAADKTLAARRLAKLMESESIKISEAEPTDYSLLGEIHFEHPLFAPLSDPRFNDFTKIHFWKHRVLAVDEGDRRIVAKFDDGSPALIHHVHGKGDLYVLTSGWQPKDSQLALSSKFVPLLSGMVPRMGELSWRGRDFEVYQSVPIPESAIPTQWTVVRPDNVEIPLPAKAATFDDADRPGLYRLRSAEQLQGIAVNLAANECRTDPLTTDQIELQGVRLGWHLDDEAELERRRQQRDIELEGQQRIWQWLIAAVLGLLLVETWLAGRLSLKRSSNEPLADNLRESESRSAERAGEPGGDFAVVQK